MMTVGCYWVTSRPSVSTFDFTAIDYFVKFAQRRIGVNITVRPKLPGCPFALLERLATRIAKRLP